MTTLFVPWLLAGFGIVLRGAAFAFRKFSATLGEARLYGVVFASSSLITPFFLGMIAGAVASGRVPADGYGDVGRRGPARRRGSAARWRCSPARSSRARSSRPISPVPVIARWRRRWGVERSCAGAITGAVALAAVFVLEVDAESLADGLHGRGAALIAVSAVAGLFSLWRLHAGRWALARVGAVVAVAAIVIGWGVGQYPDLLVDELTIADAAGARSTLIGLIIVFGLASVTAVPALLWLYVLVNRSEWAPGSASAKSQ